MDMLALAIQSAISSAVTSVAIMTPYFLPHRDLISAIQSAALRGVNVRIVLPKKNNLFYMQWAHQNLLVELLNCGVHVFYQDGPFCHTKLICIDDEYTLMGSANLDQRSLRLNFELGVEIFSTTLNTELREYFNHCLEQSSAINLVDLERRSLFVRLRDSIAALLSPYL
jgi:cardiolipin synthase